MNLKGFLKNSTTRFVNLVDLEVLFDVIIGVINIRPVSIPS